MTFIRLVAGKWDIRKMIADGKGMGVTVSDEKGGTANVTIADVYQPACVARVTYL